jgi:hypothetical protein
METSASHAGDRFAITSIDQLETLYGAPSRAAVAKEATYLTPFYRALIDASPFAVLATAGPEGLDCSPRGDRGRCVMVQDERTLLLPDRRGNNRIDSLRNIVSDPRVAVLFLIPGAGMTFRVNGRAVITVDPALLDALAVGPDRPRTAIRITVERCYFQCARAVLRSRLWDAAAWPDTSCLPSAGTMLAALSDGSIDAARYDSDWPEKAANTLW